MNKELTQQELEVRNKDSLIRYIGALQAQLRLLYDNTMLDNSRRKALNSQHDEDPATIR